MKLGNKGLQRAGTGAVVVYFNAVQPILSQPYLDCRSPSVQTVFHQLLDASGFDTTTRQK